MRSFGKKQKKKDKLEFNYIIAGVSNDFNHDSVIRARVHNMAPETMATKCNSVIINQYPTEA